MSLLYEHDRFSVNEQCQPYRNEWMHNSDNADMVGVLHLFAGDITKCSLINTNWRKGSWGCHWSSLVKDYINFRRQPSPKLLENIERPSLILDGSKMDISFLMTMMVNLVHLCLKRNKATWHAASPSTKQTQPLNKRHPNRIWKWQTIGRENQSNLDEGRILRKSIRISAWIWTDFA